MNDAVWAWFSALSAPLNSQAMPVYGSSTPTTGNGLAFGIGTGVAVVDVGAEVVLEEVVLVGEERTPPEDVGWAPRRPTQASSLTGS